MLPITLETLAAYTGGRVSCPDSRVLSALALRVVTDNRDVEAGDVFFAIEGERVDGNTFAGDACARGAAAVVTHNESAALEGGADPARLVVVPDIYRAIGDLARAQLARLREDSSTKLTVVGITGSAGKTTTKDLLSKMLTPRGPLIAPPGSFNNALGLPLTVLRANADTSTLVLEMGAGEPGDLTYLTSIAPPDVAVVLLVARAHVGYIGGIEEVAAEKSCLLRGARPGAPVILNGDDVRVVAMSEVASGPITYFSRRGHVLEEGLEADVWASDCTVDERGHAHFTLHAGQDARTLTLALVGEHHVSNALAAASTALALGIPLDHIVEVLEQFGPLSAHRMNVKEGSHFTLVDDSFNANPDSMRAGVQAAAHLATERRLVAVLGCMAELGSTDHAEHAALGRALAQMGVDCLIGVGEGVEALVEAARESGVATVEHIALAGAPSQVEALLSEGDVVLVKGSHSSGAWQVADALAAAIDKSLIDKA